MTEPRAVPRSAKPLRSIRFQIVAAVAAASIAAGLVLLPVAQRLIDRSFQSFEVAHAQRESERLRVLLRGAGESLGRTAVDYSRWDETVLFVEGRHPEWLDEQLTPDVLENFGVDLIAVTDRALRPVGIRDREPGLRERLPRLLTERRLCERAQLRREPTYRYAMHADGPHLLVCSPVMGQQPGEKEVNGSMLWVAPLTDARRQEIERIAQYTFTLEPLTTEFGPELWHSFGGEHLEVRIPVPDGDGHAALEAHLRLPRLLGAQRTVATRVAMTLLGVAVLLPPLLVMLFLEALVVRRIQRVSHWVRATRLGGPVVVESQLRRIADGRAGFSELQKLAQDVAALAEHLDALRAGWQAAAMSDSLTGLSNRARLMLDLDQWLETTDSRVGLLLMDLDGFKAVNDTLGHPVGDGLLREFGERLVQLLPPNACAYRLGGDEFAVAMRGADEDAIEGLAARLTRELHFVRQAVDAPLVVTASVGTAISGNEESLAVSELLTRADVAMYEAKRIGRAMHRRYTPKLRVEQRERTEVVNALRAALEQGRVQAWFQPIAHALDGRVLAIEALARWEEPGWGWVSPARFIPTAERAGLIAELDLAVIRDALGTFGPLRQAHPDLRLHVNVSARSLVDAGFVERLIDCVRGSGIHAQAVALELTETELSITHDQLESALASLRAAGMQLIIDDFGVGASSLSRLAAIQPEAIKIDGTFVRDVHGSGGRICRAIVELARELGLATVAEYVEREDQAAALAAMGCTSLQGYGVAQPMPAEALFDWMDQRAAGRSTRRGAF